MGREWCQIRRNSPIIIFISMQNGKTQRPSVIQLGGSRRATSLMGLSTQKPPLPFQSSTYQPSSNYNITSSIDSRLEWTYSGILKDTIKDITSNDTMFPNDLLKEYIQYVYNTYNIQDPLTSIREKGRQGSMFESPVRKISKNQSRRTADRTWSNRDQPESNAFSFDDTVRDRPLLTINELQQQQAQRTSGIQYDQDGVDHRSSIINSLAQSRDRPSLPRPVQ